MARVKVKTLGILYNITGSIEHELEISDGATVGEVVAELASRFKGLKEEIFTSDGRFSEDYRILLNGREVAYLEGEKTRVKNGDEIVIIPPVGGG